MKHSHVLVGAPLETIGSHHDVCGSMCGCLIWEAGERGGGQKVRRVESEEGKGRGERTKGELGDGRGCGGSWKGFGKSHFS